MNSRPTSFFPNENQDIKEEDKSKLDTIIEQENESSTAQLKSEISSKRAKLVKVQKN